MVIKQQVTFYEFSLYIYISIYCNFNVITILLIFGFLHDQAIYVHDAKKELCFRLYCIQLTYRIANLFLMFAWVARIYIAPIHGHSVNHDKWKGDKISKISCRIRAYFTLVMHITTAPATGHTKI